MARRALVLLILASSIVHFASAQQEVRRFEVGAQTTVLGLPGQSPSCAACPDAQWSGGPAGTFNINRHFGIDGAFTFRPGPAGNPSWQVGGNLSQMLLGVKATTRGSRFSLFGTVRPGYVRWSHGQVVSLRMPLLDGPLVYSYRARTNFGVDLGVGLEHALKTRMRVRVEMGDTVMWWHHYDTNHLDPPPFLSTISSSLRLTTGIFYSFGAGIPIQPTEAVPNAHRFFDKPNVALFSAGLLAQAADSITTQRRIGQCHKQSVGSDINCVQLEANPLARPFVVHGWGGQIAIDAISDAAQVSVALALHRLGHHTIERFVTVPATVLGAVYSYRSLQGHW